MRIEKMENTSGRGKATIVPPGIKGWNWGAFFFSVIWAVAHRTWIGLLTVTLFVVAFTAMFYVAFSTGEPETGEHEASVEWLPASATDVTYYRREGFGWIRNYDCLIPEADLLKFAEQMGWKLEGEGDVLFYGKWYPNGGGTAVNYNRTTQRLTVRSNHR